MRKGLKLSTYFFVICLIAISSCSKQIYLYDQVGFEEGRRPNESVTGSNSGGPVPNGYYRTAPTAPYQQNNYAPYPPQQYQQPYQQPAYQPPYQPPYQPVPASRFYSNPYAIPASPYPSTYDADQYYVPPNQYGAEPADNRNRDPR